MTARARAPRRSGRSAPRTAGTGARARRGSVTVVAGIFMVMLSAFGAVAIDASRLFTVRAELQTIADAAALAGALQMLRDSSVAADSARAYAVRNGLDASDDEFEPDLGVWSVATGTFLDGADPADAIHVHVRRDVPFLLAQMFGTEGVRLETTSTAWSSAPVSGSNECMKPLMLPYSYVRDLVDPPSAEMTPDDVRRLREMTAAQRTDSFTYGNGVANPSSNYLAVSLPPVVRANGEAMETSQGNYQSYIGQCRTTNVAPGDYVLILPGDRRANTVNGLRDMCQGSVQTGGMGGSFVDGTCYVNGTATGMSIKVAFWETPPQYGNFGVGAVQVKMLGSFVLQNIDPRPDPQNGVQRATMRGYLDLAEDHGAVGNGPSLLRRAVIVE